MYRPNLQSAALAVPNPEIMAFVVLGWGCELPSILGKVKAVGGRGWYCLKERLWFPISSP